MQHAGRRSPSYDVIFIGAKGHGHGPHLHIRHLEVDDLDPMGNGIEQRLAGLLCHLPSNLSSLPKNIGFINTGLEGSEVFRALLMSDSHDSELSSGL